MSRTYEKASPEVMAVMTSALDGFHEDLVRAEVRVGVVMVEPAKDSHGQPTAPAIVHNGVAALARIKPTTPKERVYIPCDAIIEVDAEQYHALSGGQALALFDHELEHLVLKRGVKNELKPADDGRPGLTTRPDSWTLTGFESIVRRHGPDAIEYRTLQEVITRTDENGQHLFPWAEPAKKKKSRSDAA